MHRLSNDYKQNKYPYTYLSSKISILHFTLIPRSPFAAFGHPDTTHITLLHQTLIITLIPFLPDCYSCFQLMDRSQKRA